MKLKKSSICQMRLLDKAWACRTGGRCVWTPKRWRELLDDVRLTCPLRSSRPRRMWWLAVRSSRWRAARREHCAEAEDRAKALVGRRNRQASARPRRRRFFPMRE
jgi:hypothetical protein